MRSFQWSARRITSPLELLFAVLALGALAATVASSFLHPYMPWDSWAYHLPFSRLIWDGYATNFILGEDLRVRLDGFPVFAEALQGLLWKTTGRLSATTMINSLSLVAFVITAAKACKLSLPLLAFGTLCFPLVAIHAISNYIDLFVASAVCFQFLAAIKLNEILATENGLEKKKRFQWAAVFVVAAGVAGNSKTFAPVICFLITLFSWLLIFKGNIASRNGRNLAFLLGVATIATFFSLATAMKNLVVFGNPIYPFAYQVPLLGIQLPGPEIEYKNYPGYADGLGVLAKPVYWLASISELDWSIRGVVREGVRYFVCEA